MAELDKLLNFLQIDLFGLSVWRVLAGLFLFLLIMFARKLFDIYVISALRKLAARTHFAYDDQVVVALSKPVSYFFFFGGLYAALRVINPGPVGGVDYSTFLLQTFRVISATLAVWTAYRLTDVFANFISDRMSRSEDELKQQFIPLFRSSIRVFIIVVGALLIVQNLGYSVSSLLAGLGIGGLAVALAAQETLANFFASVLLLTDMPFRMGDWIRFGDTEGVVETVGFRTTRIRTFEKSLIAVPNKMLTSGAIENFSMRERRRIYTNLSITYDTPADRVETFVSAIKKILADHPRIHDDFYLVYFDKFESCSLNVMVYCFTNTIVWAEYLQIKEELNLAFLRLAESLDIEYAFPSQTLYWGRSSSPVGLAKLPPI